MKAIIARAPVDSLSLLFGGYHCKMGASSSNRHTERERPHTAPEAARAKDCLFFCLAIELGRIRGQIKAPNLLLLTRSWLPFPLLMGSRWRALGWTALGDTAFPLHIRLLMGIKVGATTAPLSCIWALVSDTNTLRVKWPLEKLRLWSPPLCFKFHAVHSEIRARNL